MRLRGAHAGKGREPRGWKPRRGKRAWPSAASARGSQKQFLGATVQHQDLIDYLESFEGSAGRGLYIYGSVGRGKSYSAAALANAFVDAGYRTVFTTASAMLEDQGELLGERETDSVISDTLHATSSSSTTSAKRMPGVVLEHDVPCDKRPIRKT